MLSPWKRLLDNFLPSAQRAARRRRRSWRASLEQLEDRTLLSGPSGYTPIQIRDAYGINLINGDGSGQTIALVDAYNDPKLVSTTDPNFNTSDLHMFDVQFGLPDPPSFLKIDKSGGKVDPAGPGDLHSWEAEESLDVEWAHAIAPGANIIMVEMPNSGLVDTGMNSGVEIARQMAGVSVISMSFAQIVDPNDPRSFAAANALMTTPAGHINETFVSGAGDLGAQVNFPAVSPNVLGVGGTSLFLNGNNYQSEKAWSGSGGGVAGKAFPEPEYQLMTQSTGFRTTPDVAFLADPATGVAIYDSYDNPTTGWEEIGGTSLSAPCWAGLIAIADQQRVNAQLGTLDGATQTLPLIYDLGNSPSASSYFHDITSGSNGNPAGPGYDLVTGFGTPIANALVPALAEQGPLDYQAPDTGTNHIELEVDSLYFLVFDNGRLVARKAIAGTDAVNLTGGTDANNNFDIDGSLANVPVSIQMGDGTDVANIAATTEDLDSIQGNVTVYPGTGNDTLNVNDQNNTAADTYTLTGPSQAGGVFGSSITRTNSALISFSGLDSINLLAGHATAGGTQETISVGGIQPGANTIINVGTKTTQITVQGTAFAQVGSLTINGAGNTTLKFDYSSLFARRYTFTTDEVSSDAMLPVFYQNVQSVSFTGGLSSAQSPAIYNVEGTALGSRLNLNPGPGSCVVNVTPTDKTFSDLDSALTITGNSKGNTMVVLNDQNYQAQSGTDTYRIDTTAVTRDFSIPISFYSVQGVTLNGDNNAQDTYLVQGTSTGTPVTIQTGTGTNNVSVAPMTGSLQSLGAGLTINGNTGSTLVLLHDKNHPSGDSFVITSSSITFSDPIFINYTHVSSITLDGGSSESYDVEGVAAGTSFTLNTGKGQNVVNVTPMAQNLANISGSLTVTGNSGPVTLDNLGATGQITYTLTDSTVQDGNLPAISFPVLQGMVLEAGAGPNIFNYQGRTVSNLTVMGGGSSDVLNVNAEANAFSNTYTVTGSTISRKGGATISYEDVGQVNLTTFQGQNTINIQSTSCALTVNDQGGLAGTVNVGSAGSVQGIAAPLKIANTSTTSGITIDDSADTASRDAALAASEVLGLAPAAIFFPSSSPALTSLTVKGGGGNNTFSVFGTPQVQATGSITLDSGSGDDTVNVAAITSPLSVDGQAGKNVINIGLTLLIPGPGGVTGGPGGLPTPETTVQSILAPLTLAAKGGSATVNVNDSGDSLGKIATLSSSALTGLAPAPINFASGRFLSTLTISEGPGDDSFTVTSTPAVQSGGGISINAITGTVTVQATTSPLTVNMVAAPNFGRGPNGGPTGGPQVTGVQVTLGFGGLAGFAGPVMVNGLGSPGDSLIIDDFASNSDVYSLHAISSTATQLDRSGIRPIVYSGMPEVQLTGGGFSIFNIDSLGGNAQTDIYTQGGSSFNVSGNSRNLDGISGILAIHGVPNAGSNNGTAILTLDDGANTLLSTWTAQPYTTPGELELTRDATASGGGLATIVYDHISQMTVNGGSGGNKFGLQACAAMNLFSGIGNDTIQVNPVNASDPVTSFGGPLTINGQAGTNTLDFSAMVADVAVNLPMGTAALLNLGQGTATTFISSITHISNVIGSQGNDILVGQGGSSLQATGVGRNLLIAGHHPTTLTGGSGQDILIGGSTQFDTNTAALIAILQEWTRQDIDYNARVSDITGGTGLNVGYALNATTVHSNGGGNTLLGGADLDLFFAAMTDTLDATMGETAIAIN